MNDNDTCVCYTDFLANITMQFNFEGRNDLVKFLKLIADAGLYAHLRIGPYVCAEWNYGYVYYMLLFDRMSVLWST